ncbi:tRNA-dihydrouridine synthase [Snodgrassella sp. W8132]|uniref:tRNA dihydrouridine synthase n=1 Tax=Snodgrassella sp. W8132 TaxID=2750994 RepID=UPI0018DEC502|nr:tRNA-dihydrouridine synthase [Snodgrassella sp. W8132]MBI0132841.1 tRNA-dihydrouridine synthase [Snodgrassella sp. W8132]
MQGLIDAPMRDLLTRIGGFDVCITEFVRITHTIHGRSIWLKYMPELTNNNQTQAGTAVVVQILGSDSENMALNAQKVVELGATHIDLNFGCPAPTVNQHQGGAVLLQYPDKIEQIVAKVRKSLPDKIMLSAKMRLGYENKDLALDCAQAIEQGGAQQLTVHARTKSEGYRPPAHWEWIGRINQVVRIPVIANGDVFTLADYQKIRAVSNCTDVMLGRGAIQCPDLARQIAAYNHGQVIPALSWQEILPWINDFFNSCCDKAAEGSAYPVSRLKQWLGMLKLNYPEAGKLFTQLRTLTAVNQISQVLNQQLEESQNSV